LAGWAQIKPAPYMQFGEMAHNILEEVYTEAREGRKHTPDATEIKTRIDTVVRKLAKEYGQKADKDFYDKLEYNAALLEAVLPGYFKYWEKEDFNKIKWVEAEKEFQFMLPLEPENGVAIKGKRDAMYEMANSYYLFETKTKAQIDENTIQELLAFDFQTDLYSLAVEKDYGKYPAGCRYNIIRRPGNKLGKTETLPAFIKRVSQEVLSRPEYYFIRYKIDISKKKMELFQRELVQIVKEFQDWQNKKLPTYKNTYSCISRYGSCQYLGICANGDYAGFYQRQTVHPELSQPYPHKYKDGGSISDKHTVVETRRRK
jgi:hypothetical protein